MADETDLALLQQRVRELEAEVASLSRNSRRFEALLDAEVLGIMVMDAETRVTQVSRGWEKMWEVPGELVINLGYRMATDPRSEELGVLPGIGRAKAGEAATLPLMSYDPNQNPMVKAGRPVQWFGAVLCPVKSASGTVEEMVLLEWDVSNLQEIKLRNEALLSEQQVLEASLRERNRELEERIALIEAQKSAIDKLSVPVIQVWEGILVLPLVGMVDDARASRILSDLLDAVTARGATDVILDITGVPTLDPDAANNLLRTVAAARLVGAECTLSGVSPAIAQTLLTFAVDLGGLMTCGTLEEGLKRAIQRRRKDQAGTGIRGARRG